jgi:hypothetical protein
MDEKAERSQMTNPGDINRTFADAEDEFMRAHREMLQDPRNDVESLDRAGCGPRVTNLARLAIGANTEGRSAAEWRSRITDDLGAEVEPFLDQAEECMRVSGLWPWPS